MIMACYQSEEGSGAEMTGVLITACLTFLLIQETFGNTCRCDCNPIHHQNPYQEKTVEGFGSDGYLHQESLQDRALQAHVLHLVPMAHQGGLQDYQSPETVEEKKYETSEHQVSEVSSNQKDHYIKLEQHIPLKKAGDEGEHYKEDHDHHHHHHNKDVYYEFEYAVDDRKTHDIKSQKEERKADRVNGEYFLVEPDGNVRTVKYQADWKNGFHAQVHNSKKKQSFG